MPSDDHVSSRNQFGIRTMLVVTGGLACFAACTRMLTDIGVPSVMIAMVTIPSVIGTFWGIAVAQTKKRNELLGSLIGGSAGFLLPVLHLSLIAVSGPPKRWWGQSESLTVALLGLFAALFCLSVSAIVGFHSDG